MSKLPERVAAEIHSRLENDLPYFSEKVLKIKPKTGDIVPFIFNTAQIYLHQQLEKQRKETGKVRAIVTKGRQQGCSTYVAARFYHRATRKKGQSVFILSHESGTTEKLFKMVERFHDNIPGAVKPVAEVSNRRELVFSQLESNYTVGTAGNKNVGRGGTIQLFHGSEVAHWESTDQIQTGILQSVPDLPDTEIILESTANGMTGFFYETCMDALDKQNDYISIFIPWYWQQEYRRAGAHDGVYELTPEEEEYQKLYSQSPYKHTPLDKEQIYWRRAKIKELKSEWKFKQEYPSFLQEAFQTSSESLISAQSIMRARKSKVTDREAPLIMGVDPGRNIDRTVFVYRRGREVPDYEVFRFEESENVQMVIAGMIAQRIKKHNPAMVNIDVGHGYGVMDRLNEMGFKRLVHGVHFGEEAIESTVYINKRAEMWCLMRDWFHGEEGEVRVPDRDELQRDIMCMPREKPTSSNKIQLESKLLIRKLYKISTDIGDGLALTFAYPVATPNFGGMKIHSKNNGASALITLRKVRRQDTINTGRSGLITNKNWTKKS